MSLNQKYTWQDFLKENPEHKEKRTRRTSTDGKKAFESAYKAHIKKYLTDRTESAEKLIVKAGERRKTLVEKTKATRKAGHLKQTKVADRKIAMVDAAIARHQRMKEKTKQLQKSFK